MDIKDLYCEAWYLVKNIECKCNFYFNLALTTQLDQVTGLFFQRFITDKKETTF